MKKFLCLIGFMTMASSAYASITVSSQTWAKSPGSGVASASINCQGGDFLMAVTMDQLGKFPTAATYNGFTMTMATQTLNSGGPIAISMWYIKSPSAGTNAIAWTCASCQADVGAVCLSGTNTTTPLDTASCTIANTSLSWNTTVDNDMLLDTALDNVNQAIAPGGGQTQQFVSGAGNGTGGQTEGGSSKLSGTHGSQTMSWTGASQWMMCAIGVQPASGAAVAGSYSKQKRYDRDE